MFDRKARRRRKSGRVFNIDIIEGPLSVFKVASANYWRFPQLTFQSANRFPDLLLRLLTQLDLIRDFDLVVDIEVFAAEQEPTADASSLAELFERHGSDKAVHGYHVAYAAILRRLARKGPPIVLEIGLGTNNSKLVSSMGSGGRPGASLRAFRDFLPGSSIYGADVDASILFQEERIRTAFVDQTKPESFDQMTGALGTEHFDLIIDDGLHSVEANMNTLLLGLGRLKPGGWLAIEDIPEPTVVVWKSIVGLLNQTHFKARLVKAKMAHMVVVENCAANSPPK